MDLENFLKTRGMKQADLAKALGTSAQNVSKWVSGEGVPSFDFCKKLLELGVSVEDLFGITETDRITDRITDRLPYRVTDRETEVGSKK